ncbi:MAG TPA: hypothetical protein VHM20_04735, partial [Gammaproteobacteria bacterium]|nr:hypothetical protein [Gammaproteobacteria bacterium]
VDKNHVIHIKTNDKMLSKSYILMCQLYGLPLESELQISSPKKLKAVSLRLQQLLVPPAKTSLLTRMRGWFGATVVKKPVKSGDATSSSSTRSMTSLFRNKGPAPSMLGKMCGALENHLFNYEESDSESGKAIAFTKLVEDTKLLETARKNLVTESSEQDLKRADVLLQKIHKLLPKKFVDSEEAIKADEVINGPTEEVKKEVDNRFGRGFRGPG